MFDGLTASDNAIVIRGYYENGASIVKIIEK